MIKYLLIISALLFCVGAIRRAFFAAWRITIPLTVGAIIGLPISAMFVNSGAPAWMMIVGPIFAAFTIGGALSQGLGDISRPPRR